MSIQMDGVEVRCITGGCGWRAVRETPQAARAAGRRHRENAGNGPGEEAHIVVVDDEN